MDWQATTRLWLLKWFEGSTHVCWQHPACLSFSITRVPSLDWNPVSAGYLLTYQVRLMMFFFTTSIHIHHYTRPYTSMVVLLTIVVPCPSLCAERRCGILVGESLDVCCCTITNNQRIMPELRVASVFPDDRAKNKMQWQGDSKHTWDHKHNLTWRHHL